MCNSFRWEWENLNPEGADNDTGVQCALLAPRFGSEIFNSVKIETNTNKINQFLPFRTLGEWETVEYLEGEAWRFR